MALSFSRSSLLRRSSADTTPETLQRFKHPHMSFLYREAGRVLKGVESGKASLKTLTLGRTNSVGGGKGGDENGPKRCVWGVRRHQAAGGRVWCHIEPGRALN